jgi:gas vesicle protein
VDLLSAAKDFGLPVLGAAAGFIATSYAVRTDVKQLKALVSALKKGWRLEFESHKEESVKKHKEQKEEIEKKYKELKDQLKEVEENLNKWQRESSHSFASDEELNRFIEDQQRQWQLIQRTLGQIEGWMKRNS